MTHAFAVGYAQELLDIHPDGCLAVDSAWNLVYVNPAAERVLGLNRDEVLHRELWSAVPDYFNGESGDRLRRAMADRQPATFVAKKQGRAVDIRLIPAKHGGLLLCLREIPADSLEVRAQREIAELELIYQTAPVGLLFVDTDLRYVRINDLLAEINGRPAEAHIGHTIEEMLPEIAPVVTPGYRRVIESGKPILNKEVIGATPAQPGIQRSFLVNAYPVLDATGTVVGLTSMVQETTERKRTEEALKLQASVLASMTEGVSVCDENGVILYTNPAEDRMFGYAPGELIGQHVSVQVAGGDSRNIVGGVIEQLKSSGSWKGEFESRKKDGAEFTSYARIGALESSGKKYMVCVEEDITERRQAERALQESDERYSALAELLPVIVWTAAAGGGMDYFNSQWYRYTGQTSVEAHGHGWQAAIHADDKTRFLEIWDRAARTGEFDETEFRLRDTQGDYRWFLGRCIPLRNDAGTILKWFGTYADIDGRKRAAEALREVNQTLQTIIQASPLPVIAFAADGNVTLWNPAAEQVFGWTEAEVVGRPIPFIPPDKRDEHSSMRERDLRGECFTGVELRRIRKDGSPIDISVSTAPIRGETGAITGIMSLYVDITGEKRIQEALRESEERYRFLAESLPQMVWTADADGTVDYCNRHWAGYTGLDLEQTRRAGWNSVVHPADREKLSQAARAAETGRSEYKAECRLRRAADGAYRWHLASAKPYQDAGGSWKWLGTAMDIHNRIAAEEIVREANRSLHRANDSLKQFAYAAAHDLQEPLRMVSLYSQLISRQYGGKLDSDADECLGVLTESALRMQDLVRDLLEFTQVGDVDGQAPEAVDCNRVMVTVTKNLQAAIAESSAIIRHQDLPVVAAHSAQVTQLFQNLIGNALKYRSEAQPRIEVRASRRETQWLFAVSDNGIGIAPEHHERIFGVFKRLHRGQYPGTGIGLAICARVVERYGGKIWVESEEGQGAVFYFTLPAK